MNMVINALKNWAEAGHKQSVVGGVYEEDQVDFPDGVKFYPVFYQTEDTELIKNLNMYVISRFYTKPYEEAQDFYVQFYERLKEAKNLLSLGV